MLVLHLSSHPVNGTFGVCHSGQKKERHRLKWREGGWREKEKDRKRKEKKETEK